MSFAGWGRFVHRHRVGVLAASAILLLASMVALGQGGALHSYQLPEGTDSADAAALMNAQIGASDSEFVIIFSHASLSWRDAAFKGALLAALQPLRGDARIDSIIEPYALPASAVGPYISHDGHRALVVVTMTGAQVSARDAFPDLAAKVRSSTLDIKMTGSVAIYSEVEQVLDKDLKRAEIIALPPTLLLLLLVFGTAVAALLPLGVGLLAVASGVAGVLLTSRVTDMSVYAVNIVTLIGLGVAIDYSLFIVSRYREEIAKGGDPVEALATTMATAGRATAFSGLTVAVGLAGLMFYKGLFFASVGLAGAIVVTFAVLYALTFLAAILAMLGPRIERWRIPVPRPRRERDMWGTIARSVMRRPWLYLIPTLIVVLAAGSPFLRLEMANAGVEMLPETAHTRIAADILHDDFPSVGRNPITVVLDHGARDPLSRDGIGALYDLSRTLGALPGVVRVDSIVDLDPRLSRAEYQEMYAQPRASLSPPVQSALDHAVGTSIAVITVRTDAAAASDEARDLVLAIRAQESPAGTRTLVTGTTAFDVDTLDLVYRYTPAALLFIVVSTYLLLLAQTGSIVLPAKAIIMNFLSIAASFGALVWVFQEGNLSAVLGFTPAPLDPSVPVLLFCIVFGLSMDYEVLLLSRMHEEWERTGDNTAAVANGLAKSGRLITSAAAIMILVFGAFTLASVAIIKAIGFGLALAIAIDATLVRALVVPATMRLMGELNWYAPAWLARWMRPARH